MNNMMTHFENLTCTTPEYQRISRLSVYYDRQKMLFLLAAGILALLAVLLVFLNAYFIALCVIALAVAVIWIRPLFSIFQKNAPETEIKTVFSEREFTQTIGESEHRYFYSGIKRVTCFGRWFLLECYKGRVVLDAAGFEGITADEFISFIHRNFPQVPIKEKKTDSFVCRFLPFILATVLCITATECSTYLNLSKQTEPAQTGSSVYENTDISTPINDSRIIAQTLEKKDCDLFNIELPKSLQSYTDYYLTKTFYTNYEETVIAIKFIPKNIYDYNEMSLNDYVSYFVETNSDYELSNVSLSKAGNPSLHNRYKRYDGYLVFLECEYFFVTISFSTNTKNYETYLPHFEKWEASIQWNETPSGSIMLEPKKYYTSDLTMTLPASFCEMETSYDWCVQNPQNVGICVASTEKPTGTTAHGALEYYLQYCAEEHVITDFSGALALSPNGNASYVTSYVEFDYGVYFVVFESENKYIRIQFEAPAELFDEYLPLFQEWEAQIVVKG